MDQRLIFLWILGLVAGAHSAYAVGEGATGSGKAFSAEVVNLRDPFKRLYRKVDQSLTSNLTELEKVPLSEIKLLGIITGGKEVRAMVSSTGGTTYTVGENTLIGNRSGIIVKITSKGIRVKERFINLRGDEDFNITDIKLPSAIKVGDLKGSRKRDVGSMMSQRSSESPLDVSRVNSTSSGSRVDAEADPTGMGEGAVKSVKDEVSAATQGMRTDGAKIDAEVQSQ